MATALNTARKFLQLAAVEQEPEPITHLRLHKLLYYAQGWSLAIRKKPLFDDEIQAWAHGPVVRNLYRHFAEHKAGVIPAADYGEPKKLTAEECDLIEQVWETYKGYSPAALRQMTHAETPWMTAHKGYGPADRCEEVISQESMREFFESEMARQ